jgi:hypothetical protein
MRPPGFAQDPLVDDHLVVVWPGCHGISARCPQAAAELGRIIQKTSMSPARCTDSEVAVPVPLKIAADGEPNVGKPPDPRKVLTPNHARAAIKKAPTAKPIPNLKPVPRFNGAGAGAGATDSTASSTIGAPHDGHLCARGGRVAAQLAHKLSRVDTGDEPATRANDFATNRDRTTASPPASSMRRTDRA